MIQPHASSSMQDRRLEHCFSIIPRPSANLLASRGEHDLERTKSSNCTENQESDLLTFRNHRETYRAMMSAGMYPSDVARTRFDTIPF
jgi:hypothetical protein